MFQKVTKLQTSTDEIRAPFQALKELTLTSRETMTISIMKQKGNKYRNCSIINW